MTMTLTVTTTSTMAMAMTMTIFYLVNKNNDIMQVIINKLITF